MIRFFYAIFGRRAEIGPICLLTLKGGSCIIYIRSSGVRKRIAPLFDHASFLSAMGVDFPQSPLRFPPSRGAHPRRAPFFLNPPPSVKRTVFYMRSRSFPLRDASNMSTGQKRPPARLPAGVRILFRIREAPSRSSPRPRCGSPKRASTCPSQISAMRQNSVGRIRKAPQN